MSAVIEVCNTAVKQIAVSTVVVNYQQVQQDRMKESWVRALTALLAWWRAYIRSKMQGIV